MASRQQMLSNSTTFPRSTVTKLIRMSPRIPFLQQLVVLTLSHIIICYSLNQTQSYSTTDAIRQVNYCGAAYCTDPSFKSGQVQEWNCRACKATPYVEAKVFSGGLADANGYVGYEKHSNVIIVAFSGTDAVSKKNWIEDFDFPLIPYTHCKNCMVHNGFYLTMLSVIGQIKEAIAIYQSIHKDAKISVTGHSLGAALASLTIAELSADESLRSTMVTTGHYVFGSPRIGNRAFAEWFASNASLTYRMVHGKDPVPHVPFQSMGFHHVHYEVFYESDYKSSKICSDSGEDDTCSNKYPIQPVLADHLTYMDMNFMENWLSCAI